MVVSVIVPSLIVAQARVFTFVVAVHEVDLLEASQPLADLLGPYLTDAIDPLELAVCGGEDLVEAAELRTMP